MARPRSEEARRKAIEAATDLIVERGVAALTIEEVAARSGVAKTTIYRHWPERPGLILDTVRASFQHVGTPDTGSLRGDLMAFFGGLVRADLSGKVGRLMPCLIDAASRDPEMELLLEQLGEEREAPIMEIIARAQHRGELPEGLDPHVVIGSIVGPIVFRKVMQRQPVDASYIEATLDVAITGLAATASAGSPQSVASGDR
jgi:AcrR family transcriptional regulator